ncbi:MAG: SRPBCC domain-containing protein [Bacteroidota bacterium]
MFEYLVQADLIAQWFGPKDMTVGTVELDTQIGGLYNIQLKESKGRSFYIQGQYIEIDPPHSLVFSLRYQGLTGDPPTSVVNIQLKEIGSEQTELSLSQKFDFLPHNMSERNQAWELMMDRLTQLIRT